MSAQTWGDLILYVGAFLCASFCLVYWLLAKWWKTEAGRHIWIFTAYLSVLLVFLSVVVAKWVNDEVRMWLRIPIYAAIIPLILWRWSMLIRAQRRTDIDTPETQRGPLDV